jgi:hypothetical protein
MKIVILVTLIMTIAVLAELGGSARAPAAVALIGKKSHRLRGPDRR